MRKIRKILAALAIVCMFVPCISVVTHAASGELRFSDPSTTVGAEVEVTARFTAPVLMDTLEATLTYDSSMLRFVSGDSATGGDGTVTISGDGGSATEAEFTLTFQALAEGTTNIEVSQSSGVDAAGDALELTNGSSAVTIGPGDPSLIQQEESSATTTAAGAQVEVDGVQYTITGGFSDALIPTGFVRGEKQFEGSNYEVVTQEASGRSAFYLTSADGGEADFFLYDDDNGSFAPFEEVEIAQDRYIVLLRDDGSVSLPSAYQETTLTLNGKEFPAWQNTDNADYYVVYALNADGEEGLYQYDTVDKTYQRYVENTGTADNESSKSGSSAGGLWGRILDFISNFLDIIVIIAAVVFLILLIVLIVTAVKLRHRDLELDDLYDEYGIDLDEEEASKSSKGKKKTAAVKGGPKGGPAVRKPAQTAQIDLNEDDFDDFEDYEEEEFDDYGTMEMEDLDEDEFDEYEEDEADEMIDDLDELLSRQPKKKRSHMEPDDTFKVDFIDLD